MDKYEIRRVKLAELRDTRCGGNTAELARRLNRNPTYVLRMLYPEGKDGRKRIADDMIEVIESTFDLPHGWLDGKSENRTIKIDLFVDENLAVRHIHPAAQEDFRAPYDCPPTAHALQSRNKKRSDGWVIVLDGIQENPAKSMGVYALYCLKDGTLDIGILSKGYINGTYNINRSIMYDGALAENQSVLWAERVLWIKP
jgi:hypothetical protein